MNKKFKFKLDAVLKVRKLKEDQCKMEIGRIQVRISELESFLEENNKGIDEAYKAQEEALRKGATGLDLKFHPFFVSGKKANMDVIKAEMNMHRESLEEKYKELNALRGEVKLVEQMKENEFAKFKKEKAKREFAEIEEQVRNWKQSVK